MIVLHRLEGGIPGTGKGKHEEITRPGKRLHNELENHHAIHGKTHYFYGHVQ